VSSGVTVSIFVLLTKGEVSTTSWTTMFKKTIIYEISFHQLKKIVDKLPLRYETAASKLTLSGFPLRKVGRFSMHFKRRMKIHFLTGKYRLTPPFDEDGVSLKHRC